MDFETKYLGLTLRNPLVVGANPLNLKPAGAMQFEKYGAAALVIPSLHAERMENEQIGLMHVMEGPSGGSAEASNYFPAHHNLTLGPEKHLEQIHQVRKAVSIPVIASVTGSWDSDWARYAGLLAQTDVDAIELNVGLLPTSEDLDAVMAEQHILELIKTVRRVVSKPIAVKLPPWFTNLANLASRLEMLGVNGLVLFSCFQQPSIDIDTLDLELIYPKVSDNELKHRWRWLALLSAQRKLDLAISGGVNNHEDVIRSLMTGADVVQLVSVLLNNEASMLASILEAFETWLKGYDYRSLADLRGSMSLERCPKPELYLQHEPVKDLMRNWKHRY